MKGGEFTFRTGSVKMQSDRIARVDNPYNVFSPRVRKRACISLPLGATGAYMMSSFQFSELPYPLSGERGFNDDLFFSFYCRKMPWVTNGWKLHFSRLYRQGTSLYNSIHNKFTD